MLHPSYTDLMTAINSEVDEGDQPIVKSRYSIVIATAKRARQIIGGAEPMVSGKGRKPLSAAIDEIYTGKVKIIGVGDAYMAEERLLELNKEVFDAFLGDDEEVLVEEHEDATVPVSEELEIEHEE